MIKRRDRRTRPSRAALPPLLAALLLLLVACAPSEGRAPRSAETPPGGPAATASPRNEGGGSGGGGSRPGGGSGGSSASPAPPRAAAYADDGSIGDMARSYLRASPARAMIVEVDWVRGREPDARALDHLRAVLERELAKPGGLRVERGGEISSAPESSTVADLMALERRHSDRRSAGDTATMWIVYMSGEFADAPDALGVAFTASAAAIYRDRIDDAATALVLAAGIERAVLVHEAGHLLALVNIGYQSQFDREDPDHPKHSRNRDSVMFWAVEDVSIANILSGGPPDDFDEHDKADLRMLRSG